MGVPAAEALHAIGAAAAPAIPNLIIALENPDNHTRASAANCLAGLGRAAKKAVPALKKATKDSRTLNGTGSAVVAQTAAANAIKAIDAGQSED